MEPFVENLVRKEQADHAHTIVGGLLSDLENKNTESIAYRFGQERMPLQWFVGMSDWADEPLREELVRQIGQQLGRDDGVLVFDPSAFPKSGQGVRRCGPSVVRSAGKGRQLPSRRLHGLCLGERTRLGRYAAVYAQGVDAGPAATREGRRPPGGALSHATSTVLGIAGPTR